MDISGQMFVIILYNPIKEVGEGDVGVSRPRVASDTWVDIFAPWKDTSLKGYTSCVHFIMVALPDFERQMLAEQRFRTSRELRPTNKIIWSLQMITTFGSF